MNVPAPQPLSGALQPEAVRQVLQRVADWQLANRTSKHDPRGWVQGALYTGLLAWADLAPSDRYRNELRRIAQDNGWKLGSRPYHADDHVVGQLYLGLHAHDDDPKEIAEVQKQFDWILQHPATTTLTFEGYDKSLAPLDRWSWCDALFMAPATWAQLYAATGDQRYLDFMIKEWWSTTDFLYDKKEHLFFRDSRFFDQREANGRKIFWSRGNGWVFAGLVRVLDVLPADHVERPRFEALFRNLANALLRAQQSDGLWRTGLLDPERWGQPETSGSAFFAYGFAWGLNHKLLDSTRFLPALRRAWPALVAAVGEDGRVGWVQPIGDAPRTLTKEMTELYGAGAFLLAGVELHKWLTSQGAAATMQVLNPLPSLRRHETIELAWEQVAKLAPALKAANLQIIDARTGQALQTQVLDLDGNGRPEKLLFQTNLGARQGALFWLRTKPAIATPATDPRLLARVVPERLDDFAWENDRVAFRMYGPALERSGEVSSGVDLWSKRGPDLVINDWYKGDDYHKDHGQGGDFYKVGPSRGCGGTGVIHGDKLGVTKNWQTAKVLAAGPVRTVFELQYAPWLGPNGGPVHEYKRVSLDYGHVFSRFETAFKHHLPAATRFAAGIVKRAGAQIKQEDKKNWLAVWEPADGGNGNTGCAVIMPAKDVAFHEIDGNVMLSQSPGAGLRFVHWAGGVWDRAGRVASSDDWNKRVADFSQRLSHPLRIKLARGQGVAATPAVRRLAVH